MLTTLDPVRARRLRERRFRSGRRCALRPWKIPQKPFSLHPHHFSVVGFEPLASVCHAGHYSCGGMHPRCLGLRSQRFYATSQQEIVFRGATVTTNTTFERQLLSREGWHCHWCPLRCNHQGVIGVFALCEILLSTAHYLSAPPTSQPVFQAGWPGYSNSQNPPAPSSRSTACPTRQTLISAHRL